MKTAKLKREMIVSKNAKGEILNFFKSILDRKFSDAKRSLIALDDKKLGDSEFKAGYLNALEGMRMSSRSGDARDLINKMKFNPESPEIYKNEFKTLFKKEGHTPFDKGFFSAWLDYLNYYLSYKKNA